MGKIISIDPITRLEGHGSLRLVYDDEGRFQDVYLQVPDFKGFEKFCEGRAVEELPALTQKICGVCPTAHHIAGVKALDDLFGVAVPPAARAIRELMHNAFIFEDHLLHFFYLGGADLFLGPDEPMMDRNVFGVIKKLGNDAGARIIDIRKQVRQLHATISGSALYPVCGLPGGVSKAISPEEKAQFQVITQKALAFAEWAVGLFHDRVLEGRHYGSLLARPYMKSDTYYMGLVDADGNVSFYDGTLRIIDPKGDVYASFEAADYLSHLAERVVPYSYMKQLYLKQVGWKGLVDGPGSGIYRVGPLARLNVSSGFDTPLAQTEYERMGAALGGWPVHSTFAYHWARFVEILYAAENMVRLSSLEQLTDSAVRNLPEGMGSSGVGVCEAPRGTLFHHYDADRKGLARGVNLLVATQNNAAGIQLSLSEAARAILAHQTEIDDTSLNVLEMVFRAYDPCMACATH